MKNHQCSTLHWKCWGGESGQSSEKWLISFISLFWIGFFFNDTLQSLICIVSRNLQGGSLLTGLDSLLLVVQSSTSVCPACQNGRCPLDTEEEKRVTVTGDNVSTWDRKHFLTSFMFTFSNDSFFFPQVYFQPSSHHISTSASFLHPMLHFLLRSASYNYKKKKKSLTLCMYF